MITMHVDVSDIHHSIQNNTYIQRQSIPSWVVPVKDFQEESNVMGEDIRLIVHEYQQHIPDETLYCHYVLKVRNEMDVQNHSTVQLSYDPSCEKIHFHLLQIHRDEKIIDKLETSKMHILQREQNIERHLYDGSFICLFLFR